MADKRIARAEHDGTEGIIIAPPGHDASALLRPVEPDATVATETVRVEWTTTIEEYYSADVDLDVWAKLTTVHDSSAQEAYLSGLEDRADVVSSAVTDRTVMGIAVNE